METLKQLKQELPHIEKLDDWAATFITDMLIRFEENPEYKCTAKQFAKINELHMRFCKHW